MNDVIVIAVVVGFFAICAAYVIWCERILASDAPPYGVGHHAEDVGRAASTADIGSERNTESPGNGVDDARVL